VVALGSTRALARCTGAQWNEGDIPPRQLNEAEEESTMPQKSPQKPAGKKPGKSLKEKREAKREKKEQRAGLGR
jgi:hypothetical protein